MKKASLVIKEIQEGTYNDVLKEVYIDESRIEKQPQRYVAAIEKFISLYGDQEIEIYSTPGRSEVSGNHTDHQNGEVLAAAINLDIIAVVSKNDVVKVLSDDYDLKPISLDDLSKKEDEVGTSEGLMRGVLARFKELGYAIGGFNGYMTSDVLQGSGLSSSAAFEVMIGTILSGLYNEMKVDPVVIGQVGQYSENVYFGKPCGLMDQSACSVGSLIHIDFKDNENPIVEKINVDDVKDDIPVVNEKKEEIMGKIGTEEIKEETRDNDNITASDLFSNLDDSETYTTYYVYIVKEEDTIDKILIKYGITKEAFEDYNDITNIKPGDKVIIPKTSE